MRVDLGSGVESETSLEVVVSNISINGSWNVDHICVDLVCLEELGNLDAVSQSVRGSNNHKTSQAILLALLGKWLKMTLIKLILGFSKVVVTTEVAVWSERFLSNPDHLIIRDTIGTIHESKNLEALALLLELKETINDVVATW